MPRAFCPRLFVCGHTTKRKAERLSAIFIIKLYGEMKMDYIIKHVKSVRELNDTLVFARRIFGEYPGIGYRTKWIDRIERDGDLMLCAESNGEIVGSIFGFIEDNGNLTADFVAVDERLRKRGIAREMMMLLEEHAKTRGIHLIALGSVQTAEGFYTKCGYTGSLLIQSEKHSIDELLSLNTKYRVNYTRVHDGTINQVNLALSAPDRELQRKYETELSGCHTQMMFWKNI